MTQKELLAAVEKRIGKPLKKHHITCARLAGLVTIEKRVGRSYLYTRKSVDGLTQYMRNRKQQPTST